MKLFKIQYGLQCLLLLLCIQPVYAFQSVNFSVNPNSGSTPPLFVTISTRNLVIPSSGFVISGYKWQVSGPETKDLAGIAEQVVQLNRTGTYAITLTINEFGIEEDGPKQVNGKNVIETFQITRTGCATNTVTVGNATTPTTNICQASENRVSLGSREVIESEPVVTDPVVTEPEPSENNPDNGNNGSSSGFEDLLGITPPTTEQPLESEPVISFFPLLGESSGASFYGGVNNGEILPNGSSFGSTSLINVEVDLKVASEHVGQPAELLVAIEYFPVGVEFGEFYFKTESTAFPFIRWDLISAMTPVQSSVTLGDIHNIKVFTSSHFQNLPGKYNIYFGYSLPEVGVFVHNYPGMPLTFNVTE